MSGYCSPATEEHSSRGLGICGLTTLRLNAKVDVNGIADGMAHHQLTDMKAEQLQQDNNIRRGSRKSSSGAVGDRRWCLILVTVCVALTLCMVLVSVVLDVVLSDRFVDKSTEDFRLKTIRQLLRDTPLIGE